MGLYEESKLAKYAANIGLGFEDDESVSHAEAEAEFLKAESELADAHEEAKEIVEDLDEATEATDKVQDVLDDANDVVEEAPEEVTPAYVESVEKHVVDILSKVYPRAKEIVAQYGFESRRVEINALMRKNGRFGLESARQTKQSIAIDGYHDLRTGLEGTMSKMKEAVAATWEALLKRFSLYVLKTKVSFNSWSIFVTKLEKRSKDIREKYESKPFEPNLSETDSNDVMKKLGAIIILKYRAVPTGTKDINGTDLLEAAKGICNAYKVENKSFADKTKDIVEKEDAGEINTLIEGLVTPATEGDLNLLGVSKSTDGKEKVSIRFSGAIGSTLSGIVFRSIDKGTKGTPDKPSNGYLPAISGTKGVILHHLESEHVSEKHDISDVTVKTADLNKLATLLKELAKATKEGNKLGTEIADEFKRAIDNVKSFRRKRGGDADTDSMKKNAINGVSHLYELNAFHTPNERYHTYTSTISGLISYVNISLDYFDKKGKKDKK